MLRGDGSCVYFRALLANVAPHPSRPHPSCQLLIHTDWNVRRTNRAVPRDKWDTFPNLNLEVWVHGCESETGRILFREVQCQTPSSASFFCPHRVPGRELSELNKPTIYVQKRTHRVFFCRTHRVRCRTQ